MNETILELAGRAYDAFRRADTRAARTREGL
jgi:hypothetical protein